MRLLTYLYIPSKGKQWKSLVWCPKALLGVSLQSLSWSYLLVSQFLVSVHVEALLKICLPAWCLKMLWFSMPFIQRWLTGICRWPCEISKIRFLLNLRKKSHSLLIPMSMNKFLTQDRKNSVAHPQLLWQCSLPLIFASPHCNHQVPLSW